MCIYIHIYYIYIHTWPLASERSMLAKAAKVPHSHRGLLSSSASQRKASPHVERVAPSDSRLGLLPPPLLAFIICNVHRGDLRM